MGRLVSYVNGFSVSDYSAPRIPRDKVSASGR